MTHDEGDLQIFVDLLFMNRHIDVSGFFENIYLTKNVYVYG